MISVWSLIKDGRFLEASVLAEEQYAETKNILSLRNGVIAWLNLGQTEKAIDLAKRIIQIRSGDTDTDYMFLGVAFWLQMKHPEALHAWQTGMGSEYKDAAGGLEIVLLQYFAAVALNNTQLLKTCEALLANNYARTAEVWPGPLSAYLLEQANTAGVSALMSASPILRAKQACQASFYFGVTAWQRHGMQAAKPFFIDTVSQGAVTLTKPEYYLAKHELSHERVAR